MNNVDLFISFLKKNRIYRKFIKNVGSTNWKGDELLINSFGWSDSEEVSMFWAKVYAKWCTYRCEHDNIEKS